MTLPNLDDRTYADIVEEAISQIPLEYPEWTDHNPTDTGIILIELLAWLTEMTLYRVNQIPDDNYASFISLLKGEQWNIPINISAQEKQKSLKTEIQKTLLELHHRYRAVTNEDYEHLILKDWNKSNDSVNLKIARVKSLAQRKIEENQANTFAKGLITLVIVPQESNSENNVEVNNLEVKYKPLLDFLDQIRLLTTRLNIVVPQYENIKIEAYLIIEDGANTEDVRNKAQAEVRSFFSPLNSGKYWQGKGWPFGKSVYLSELYKLLDNLEGVDYVENLQIKDKNDNSQAEIYLSENQLVKLQASNFTIVTTVGNERKEI